MYTAPPQEVIEQIGAAAYRPQKLFGASLSSPEEGGNEFQNIAMELVASNKQSRDEAGG